MKLLKLLKLLIMNMINILLATQELNKLTSEKFTARLKQANLASKSDIANFIKNTDFDNKLKDVTLNKNELKEL